MVISIEQNTNHTYEDGGTIEVRVDMEEEGNA